MRIIAIVAPAKQIAKVTLLTEYDEIQPSFGRALNLIPSTTPWMMASESGNAITTAPVTRSGLANGWNQLTPRITRASTAANASQKPVKTPFYLDGVAPLVYRKSTVSRNRATAIEFRLIYLEQSPVTAAHSHHRRNGVENPQQGTVKQSDNTASQLCSQLNTSHASGPDATTGTHRTHDIRR